MNRTTKWLLAVLFASWTLNVALGVAFYLNKRYPIGGGGASETPKPPDPFVGHEGRGFINEETRNEILPLRREKQRLMMELAYQFAGDSLDESAIRVLADSLHHLNGRMQGMHIDAMCQMFQALPPAARREIVPRMMRRLERNGMPPGPARRHQNRLEHP